MRKLLHAILCMAATTSLAQVPRLSLMEEFTGETCPVCPPSNTSIDMVLLNPVNSDKIEFIRWMVPIPSAPSPTWSLYRTNKTEIDWRYRPSPSGYGYTTQNTNTTAVSNGIILVPGVQLDGRDQWNFGAPSNHFAYTNNNVIDSAHDFMAPFSVTMLKAWNQNMTAMTVTVTIVAAEDFTSNGALVFRAVMIERVVQFSVAPGASGETLFRNPAIASFPDLQNGTALQSSWTTGQSMTFTLNCTVPSYRRDINQVDMVGFIQDDGNQRIEQAVRSATCSMTPITLSGPQQTLCIGESATLTAAGATSYSWSNGQTGNTIIVPVYSNTNYWVKSTDAGACENIAAIGLRTSSCTGTGINELTTTHLFALYPNPTKGKFTIKTENLSQDATILIFDLPGKLVFTQELSSEEITLETNLPKGTYLYRIISGDLVQHGKLVID